jgi:hypothetical protein
MYELFQEGGDSLRHNGRRRTAKKRDDIVPGAIHVLEGRYDETSPLQNLGCGSTRPDQRLGCDLVTNSAWSMY